ncbi:putative F420-0 ABC transporter permease subunit [Microbacterium sp. NPDC058342]|uniref:putative F420-0 ABC transporter permease subunit n=1 Tax=Microbacterium sp. NPDC058342 TaxID=3346454 RepID=UPI0036514573
MTVALPRRVAWEQPRTRGRVPAVAAVLVAAIVLSVVAASTIGTADIAPHDVLRSVLARVGIGQSGLTPLQEGIIWQLRFPRIVTAAAVGAGLALCGVVMQALTRNPLADPYLLGLSSGASVGAVLVLVLGIGIHLPVAAFLGALAALGATLALARLGGALSPSTTVLAGLAVSAIGSALTSLFILLHATGDSYREILNWLLGSLAGSSWSSVTIAMVALVVAGGPLLASGRVLDAFTLGDAGASALGVPVARMRTLLLLTTAVLTGALVSVSGSIGFVGLILPHAVRLVVGGMHRRLLPLAALAGALFLMWADTLARTVLDPRELPVGIVTALIGGPVFAYLLARRRA